MKLRIGITDGGLLVGIYTVILGSPGTSDNVVATACSQGKCSHYCNPYGSDGPTLEKVVSLGI